MADVEHRTVAFVDLAGFTTMTLAHGDRKAASMAMRFAALARAELDKGDELVKSIGDAVMLVAPDPVAGLALVGRICAQADAQPAFPVLRSGLHHGPVVSSHDDWFGATVNTAARIAARAAGGQVLGTQLIADAAAATGVAARSLGPTPLRGLPEPLELFEVVPCAALPDRLVDPVCRMAVVRPGVAWVNHDGHEFLFCSLACVSTFAADPGRFFVQASPAD